jgi:hypothetical protein
MSEPVENPDVTPEPETAQTVAETTPAAEPAPQPSPAAVSHDPYLVRQALDFGIPREEIAATDSATLQRTLYHMTRQAASLARQSPAPAVAVNEPEPEPDLGLSPQEMAELQELNPVLVKALRRTAAEAAKAKKLETELQQFRQQSVGQDLARRVNAELSKYGQALGVGTPYEQPRKNAVMNQLALLESQGMIGPNTPPEVAVPMAVNLLFGGVTPAPTPTPASPQPRPTPTARPTNRINAEDEEQTRESLVDSWSRFLREKAEKEKAAGKNGEFVP